MGEVAPLGDGEGRKNIKFHYFFGPSRTPVPTINGVCAHNRRARFENSLKLSRVKVFAELFSKSDPKKVANKIDPKKWHKKQLMECRI